MTSSLNAGDLERIYRKLRYVRRVEEAIARIYPSDRIKSPVHLSIGQESVAVGVCDALREDDYVSITYRGHAAYLAHGGDLDAMMAELYGKVTGCAKGRAGSMHLIDMKHRILGASAVVGTTIPVAVGFALAQRRQGTDRVVVAFLGDGATEEGVFAESLNFAALHRLPVLFVCENNGLAIHTSTGKRWAAPDLCKKVDALGVPAVHVAGGDVIDIREAAADALGAVRDCAGGPRFIDCETYRWHEHVGPGFDYDAGFRDRTELEAWQSRDAVADIGSRLDAGVRARIDAEIEARIARAVDFAESSPFPDPADLGRYLHAD